MLSQFEKASQVLELCDEPDPITVIGLRVYPNHLNFLQASTKITYWLDGPDPLDHINIYVNSQHNFIQYVSLGLSDLHGDERVHKKALSKKMPSGYGYELTIKVKIESSDGLTMSSNYPNWPIELLQTLARYTFENGAILDYGDHIPNVLSLYDSQSKVKNLLICKDSLFLQPNQSDNSFSTKNGRVKFLQLVGCTDDELYYAQNWSASHILDFMKEFKELGKSHLVTDLRRNKSIFELNPDLKVNVKHLLKNEGSYFGFVKANCFWRLQKSVFDKTEIVSKDESTEKYDSINIYLDYATAKLIPTILKQRLEKGNSFIFNGLDQSNLIIFPENFVNAELKVSKQAPIKTRSINRYESQVLLNNSVISDLYKFFQKINSKIYEEDRKVIDESSESSDLRDEERVNKSVLKEKFYLDLSKEFCMHLNLIDDRTILQYFEELKKII